MDRIGALPDDLLSLVLSFLATKDAVQSSVLSRRWRRLYRSVTSLDLNDGMHSSKKKFRGFVCRVLMPRCMPKIEKLRFRCDCVSKIDATYVCEWITGFVCYEVRELELMLTNCKGAPSRGSSSPRSYSFSRVFWGCPLLEDLCLVDCKYEERVEEYQISTPMLKTYTIKRRVPSRYDDKYFDLSVVRVEAKSLVYFNYHGNVGEVYCIENANAVVEAVLHVDEVCDSTFAHILPDFSSVKILHLSGLILEELEDYCCRHKDLHPKEALPSLPSHVKVMK